VPAFPALADLLTNPIETPWMTSREAAIYLRVESRTLLQWARQKHIKGYVLSGTRRMTWRFLRADLDATLHTASRVLNNGRIE
jgi:excisionase family DNA binding protein